MDTDALLQRIEKIVQNTRATWFGFFTLLFFVGVTLMGHKDSDFFAYGAETQLPVANVAVPTAAFFIATPTLTAALYIYLHMYLYGLWAALAKAPARIENDPLEEHAYPSMLCTSVLVLRSWLRDEQLPPVEGQRLATVAISFSMTWLFGPAMLGLLWWRSMPYHEEWLTLWIALWLWLMLIASIASLSCLIAAMRTGSPYTRGLPSFRITSVTVPTSLLLGFIAMVLAVASWVKTEGVIWADEKVDILVGRNAPLKRPCEVQENLLSLVSAEMRGAELTRKPREWLPYEIWLKDWEAMFREREGIEPSEPINQWRDGKAEQFRTEALRRWRSLTQSLESPNLQNADLRVADLSSAYLSGIDLREARMEKTCLEGAQLQGADLRFAQLQGADLRFAQLQGAILHEAQFQGTVLNYAQLQGLDLRFARLREADLSYAQLRGANLRQAQLQGAILHNAQFQEANLFEAQLREVDLRFAHLEGADLRYAELQGANLRGAQMQEADLRGAQMQEADMSDAQLQGANLQDAELHGVDLRGAQMQEANLRSVDLTTARHTLSQKDVNAAFGDSDTKPPSGFLAPCHWRVEPLAPYSDDEKYKAWLNSGAVPIPLNPDGTCPDKLS